MSEPNIAEDINSFVQSIDGLALTSIISTKALQDGQVAAVNELDHVVTKATQLAKSAPDKGQDAIHMLVQSHELLLRIARMVAATEAVPKSFLVALVSQFDAYLGNLLKFLYTVRPELLESSERSLTFADLSKFGSLEKARDYVLEKEIETFLRKSHAEQFSLLEKKFGVNLRTDLTVWPIFVEVTERRNLYVHTGGAISSQYLEVCSQHGVDLNGLSLGEKLPITPAYLETAHDVIYEIGIKLSQVLWRKLAPAQTKSAEDLLQNLTYSLLVERRYQLARVLLSFAHTTLQKRHTGERARLTFLINRALASYLIGDKDECIQVLDGQDWSATSDLFRLGNVVLRDAFDDAAKIMREIGPKGHPAKVEYLNWPLFTEFRKTTQFSSAFKELFGELTENDLSFPRDDQKTIEANAPSNLS